MKKLNIVSDQGGELRIQDGDIFLLDEKITSENQEDFVTLKNLEENLVLRNWNIWPRVFIYDNCLYYNFEQTFRFPSEPINPQIYSNYSYTSSVKFSTARKLTTKKKVSEAVTTHYSPFVLQQESNDEEQQGEVNTGGQAPSPNPRPGLFGAPSRVPASDNISVLPKDAEAYYQQYDSNNVIAADAETASHNQAIISDKVFDIKYSSVVTEEIINGKRVTFNELYSEIMNLVDGENGTGVSMYYHLSSLYDLIKKSGVVEIITPGSPVYTSAINLSKYVRDNCICHVTISYLLSNIEGQEQIKFSPCQLSPDGELKPLSERFEIMTDDLDTICVIECQDFCVRVFPEKTNECIISNCYITYEN